MNQAPLTPSERRRLAAIEATLRQDRTLDYRLRTLSGVSASAVLARSLLCLGLLVSLVLLVAATITASGALTMAFVIVWPITLGLATRMFRSWYRRQR